MVGLNAALTILADTGAVPVDLGVDMLQVTKLPVEADARARAGQTYLDGKPIVDAALLLRCAEQIEHLKAALAEIAAHAPNRGGLWARKLSAAALERGG